MYILANSFAETAMSVRFCIVGNQDGNSLCLNAIFELMRLPKLGINFKNSTPQCHSW